VEVVDSGIGRGGGGGGNGGEAGGGGGDGDGVEGEVCKEIEKNKAVKSRAVLRQVESPQDGTSLVG
jgi:hypothetical protein